MASKRSASLFESRKIHRGIGAVEIFLDVDNRISVCHIAGEVDLTLVGDGGVYTITVFFWAREIEP